MSKRHTESRTEHERQVNTKHQLRLTAETDAASIPGSPSFSFSVIKP